MSRPRFLLSGSSRSLPSFLWGCGASIRPNFEPCRGSMSRERLKNAPAGDATAHLGRHHRAGGFLLISRRFLNVRSSNLPQLRENDFPSSRAEDLAEKDLLSAKNDL